jgi:hypothetical protein
LVEAFVGYACALWEHRLEEKMYRTYVTDALRLVPQMSYPSKRFAEMVGWVRSEPEMTVEEITDHVCERLEGLI